MSTVINCFKSSFHMLILTQINLFIQLTRWGCCSIVALCHAASPHRYALLAKHSLAEGGQPCGCWLNRKPCRYWFHSGKNPNTTLVGSIVPPGLWNPHAKQNLYRELSNSIILSSPKILFLADE